MKTIFILFMCLFLIGCSTTNTSKSEQRWLKAAQEMIAKGDPAVSTTNLDRVKLLIQWAVPSGYTVNVSQTDPIAGIRPGMYFAVVKKN